MSAPGKVDPLSCSARETCRLLGIGRGKGRGLRTLVEAGVLHPVPWLNGRVRFALEEIQRVAREGVIPGGRSSRRRESPRRGAPAPGVGARIRSLDVEALSPRGRP